MSKSRLSAIVAVEGDVRNRSERSLTRAYQDLQRKEPLSGLTRTYTPFRDGAEYERPSETGLVQVKAVDVIAAVLEPLARLFDVTATKDFGNTQAKADVTVDGTVLVAGAPTSYLLWLEKQLVNLATFVEKLPVLEPTEEWTFDPSTNVYKSKPTGTISTKKVPKNHVKAEATDRHPAQVEVFTEDEPQGRWDTVKFSGAIPLERKVELQTRMRKLREAVKLARDEANRTEVDNISVGTGVVGYLFSE